MLVIQQEQAGETFSEVRSTNLRSSNLPQQGWRLVSHVVESSNPQRLTGVAYVLRMHRIVDLLIFCRHWQLRCMRTVLKASRRVCVMHA